MNFNFNSSTSANDSAKVGMVIKHGSQTIKMNRGGMVIENLGAQQIEIDSNGIHIYNRNTHLFVNSNTSNGNINIQTNFRYNTSDSDNDMDTEGSRNANSNESSYEESSFLSEESQPSRGFNYRISSSNMMWHTSQRISLPNISTSGFEHYYPRHEPPQKKGLTKAQINQLPVNLYNGKAKKLKITQEKRSGKKCMEISEPSTNDSCAVCILDYKNGDLLKTLPCSHKFHKGCIDKWLEMKSECPMCKHDLSNLSC